MIREKSLYRSDIDGLRAIAVIGVLLFHLESYYFRGGFVGVDVFFVISGFVITQTIWRKIQEDSFSFQNFYRRRFWRLVPAYLVILLFTLIGAFYVLSPGDLERLGKVIISAIAFVSNFFFWNEAGYFDLDAISKPLLHTWTLAVEAQFYLVYPFLLFYGLRNTGKKNRINILLIAIVLLVLLSEFFLQKDPEGAFFLAPFRFFEFLLGGLIVFLKKFESKFMWFRDLGVILGLGLVLGSFYFYTDQTPFPGFHAVIPTLGAVLLICMGRGSRISKLYDNSCLVWIGKISYSLYLIHWPLIVFFEYKGLASFEHKILIFILSFIGAALLYYFVEQKFRSTENKISTESSKGFFTPISLVIIGIGLLGFSVSLNDGWEWRYKTSLQAFVFDKKQLQRAREPYLEKPQNFTDSSRNILVVGDSHGTNVLTGIADIEDHSVRAKRIYFEDFCFHLLLGYAVHSENKAVQNRAVERCDAILEGLNSEPNIQKTDVLIFSIGWVTRQFPYMKEVVELFREKINNPNLLVVVISSGPDFNKTMQKIHELVSEGRTIEEINKIAFEEMGGRNRSKQSMRVLRKKLPENVIIVDKFKLMCEKESCYVLGQRGVPYFFDGGHWTLAGSRFFIKRLRTKYPAIFEE